MLDGLFAEYSAPGAPGIAVGVFKDGRIALAKAYGLADLERGVICSPKTNFRLASLSKQFTAMAVMILAERGKLRLDDSLADFGCPTITIRHLLTHRSGLPDYEDLIPASATAQVKDGDVPELLKGQPKTYFPPGSTFRYSNTGYVLLALIVEKISGQSFADFLRENIFQPLQMDATVAFEDGISSVSDRALGYTARQQTDQSLTSATLGDGGIYSSVEDLFRWDQALYTEKLVSREMLREAFAPSSPSSDFPGSGYGYGWYVNRDCIWHHGESCGFSSWIERYPSKQLTIVLLANRRDATLADICHALAKT